MSASEAKVAIFGYRCHVAEGPEAEEVPFETIPFRQELSITIPQEIPIEHATSIVLRDLQSPGPRSRTR